jgi:1,4-alpha-glucan branching enzyme
VKAVLCGVKKTILDGRAAMTNSTRVGKRSAETPHIPTTVQPTGSKNVNSEHPNQIMADRFPAAEEEQQVTLAFFDPKAKRVCVAGTFNYWRSDATPLKNPGSGEWAVQLMLKPGQYEYRFVVDGRWTGDPRTPQRVTNPYGEFNSVLTVNQAVKTFL